MLLHAHTLTRVWRLLACVRLSLIFPGNSPDFPWGVCFFLGESLGNTRISANFARIVGRQEDQAVVPLAAAPLTTLRTPPSSSSFVQTPSCKNSTPSFCSRANQFRAGGSTPKWEHKSGNSSRTSWTKRRGKQPVCGDSALRCAASKII